MLLMRCKAKVDFRKLGKFDTVSLVDMMAEAGKQKKSLNYNLFHTLGQKPTFYPEITKNLMFESVNFVKK